MIVYQFNYILLQLNDLLNSLNLKEQHALTVRSFCLKLWLFNSCCKYSQFWCVSYYKCWWPTLTIFIKIYWYLHFVFVFIILIFVSLGMSVSFCVVESFGLFELLLCQPGHHPCHASLYFLTITWCVFINHFITDECE